METQQPLEPIELPAKAVTREELQWLEYQSAEQLETLKRYEGVAKFLSGLFTISLTILAGSNNNAFRQISHLPVVKIAIVCWLASIVCILAVLFPFRYGYVKYSAQSISDKYNKTARVKYLLLILSTLFFLLGICITVYLYLFH